MPASSLELPTPVPQLPAVRKHPPPEYRRPAQAPVTAQPAPGAGESVVWALLFYVVTQFIPGFCLGFWFSIEVGAWDLDAFLRFAAERALPFIFAGQVLGVCLSLFALRVRVGRDWASAIRLRRPDPVNCLLAALCVPALLVVGVGVETMMEYLTGAGSPAGPLVAGGLAHYSLWFCLLVVAVGAAVNEELFCRGFLGRGLVGRYGVWAGILLTSFLFGAIHGSLTQGAWAFVLGCVLHLAYLATRSLWVPMLMHFLNNAIAVVLTAVLAGMEVTWGLPWIAVLAFAVAIPSAYALYLRRVGRDADPAVVPVLK
jgi:membrane protease YdiL (CAAX protease family)